MIIGACLVGLALKIRRLSHTRQAVPLGSDSTMP
jgi:hypothetical protein